MKNKTKLNLKLKNHENKKRKKTNKISKLGNKKTLNRYNRTIKKNTKLKTLKRTQYGGDKLQEFRRNIISEMINYLGPSLYYTRLQFDEEHKLNSPKLSYHSTESERKLLKLQNNFLIKLKKTLDKNFTIPSKFSDIYLNKQIFKGDFLKGVHDKFKILAEEKGYENLIHEFKDKLESELDEEVNKVNEEINNFKLYGFRKQKNKKDTIQILLLNLLYYYGYSSPNLHNNLQKEEVNIINSSASENFGFETEEEARELAARELAKEGFGFENNSISALSASSVMPPVVRISKASLKRQELSNENIQNIVNLREGLKQMKTGTLFKTPVNKLVGKLHPSYI